MFGDILKGVGDLIGIGATAAGAYRAFKGPPDVPDEYKREMARQDEILQMLTNPNDPRFKAQVDQEEGRIKYDFARDLQRVMTANNRNMARTGGYGLFDPERRDEAIASATKMGHANAKSAARQQVRNYLTQALGGSATLAGQFQPIINQNNEQWRSTNLGIKTLFEGAQALANPRKSVNELS